MKQTDVLRMYSESCEHFASSWLGLSTSGAEARSFTTGHDNGTCALNLDVGHNAVNLP